MAYQFCSRGDGAVIEQSRKSSTTAVKTSLDQVRWVSEHRAALEELVVRLNELTRRTHLASRYIVARLYEQGVGLAPVVTPAFLAEIFLGLTDRTRRACSERVGRMRQVVDEHLPSLLSAGRWLESDPTVI